uniref:Glyceraldehyde-3-phosphate dehydrogenase n=1 Tax=Mustela putorius furo TaxID=9669 RepID=M3Y7D6_MUSPF
VKVRGNGFDQAAFNFGKVDIVTVNDPFIDLNYMVYMFQYDSHGKFHGTIKAENRRLVINGKPMSIFQEQDPTIKWGGAAKYAVESTGVLIVMEKAGILKGGASRVTISSPSPDAPMCVMSVNRKKYDNSLKMVSSASGTTNWSPLARVIHDNFSIVEGLMTTVHAITATRLWTTPLESCDMIAKGCLEHYSCFYWHCQGLGKPIPELNGKLTGIAFQVPTHSVSVVGVTCCLEKATKYDNLKKFMRQALEGPKGILGYTEDQVVSCDFNSDTQFSTFDSGAESGALSDYFVRHISWYDNKFGYSNQMVDLMVHIASKE